MLALYMDHHVELAITRGLRRRGIDVLTAEQDGTKEYEDSALLDRATAMERILFTRDVDLLGEGSYRQANEIFFFGIVYAQQHDVSIGTCINDLETICRATVPTDVINQVFNSRFNSPRSIFLVRNNVTNPS